MLLNWRVLNIAGVRLRQVGGMELNERASLLGAPATNRAQRVAPSQQLMVA